MKATPIICTRSALTRHPWYRPASLPPVRAIYRVVLMGTGPRLASALYLPGGPGAKERKMFHTSFRAEMPQNASRLLKVTGTTAAVRAKAKAGYRSKEEDTKNRRRKRDNWWSGEERGKRKREATRRWAAVERERGWKRDMHSERAAQARSGFAYQAFCRLK